MVRQPKGHCESVQAEATDESVDGRVVFSGERAGLKMRQKAQSQCVYFVVND